MMMNFLDLSAASEEERRLIREILSDTSIVNIAEPKQANDSIIQRNHSSSSSSNTSNSKTDNNTFNTTSGGSGPAPHKHRSINSNSHNSLNSNISINSSSNGSNSSNNNNTNTNTTTTTNHYSANHMNNTQRNYNTNKHSNDRLRSGSEALAGNHINNINIASGNDEGIVNNSSSVGVPMSQTNNLDQHHANTMPLNNVYSHHHHHQHHPHQHHHHHNHHHTALAHHNMHHQVPTQVLSTAKHQLDPKNGAHKNQTLYPTQDTSMQTTMQHATATTTTDTTADTHPGAQATTVPPTQAQMPPIQGDMNSVIGMDMTSSQPPGYAIPPHVTAFGPPPHRVYGGPPIFQPNYYFIPTHPYSPYMPYVALGPPNNVVPTRQQVPPQTNQPPSTTSATMSSLPRNSHQSHQHNENSHTVTSTNTKTNNTATNHHIITQQQQNIQAASVPINNEPTGGEEMVRLAPYVGPDTDHTSLNVQDQSFKTSKTPSEQPKHTLPDKIDNKDCAVSQLDIQVSSASTNINGGEEMVKLSSDEGFETQSSLDVSKQSNESSIPLSDQIKVSPEQGGKSSKERAQRVSISGIKSDTNSGHKDNSGSNNNYSSEEPQRSGSDRGAWSSAASKSWASLFKPGSNTLLTNGETDHNISGSENSDEENKIQRSSNSTKLETMLSVGSVSSTSKEQRSQEAAKRALDKMAPRLAQKITSINLKHSLPFLKPRGFINKGNGCYINATLQALIACPPFYNLMKEIGVFRRENSCTPILDSFAELFLNFPPLDTNKKNKQSATQEQQKMNINYLQAEPIEPKCIYNVLGEIKSECLKGAQEDAEEFLSSVLNGLHEEMIGLSETLQSAQDSAIQNGHPSDVDDSYDDVADEDNLWREVGPKNRSLPIRTAKVINTPIQEIFGGSLFSIRTAGRDRCGHRSPFFDLQLDISSDNVKSVQDAIKSFTAPEVIHDFYCTKTKQKLDAQRRTSLDQLPPILILHLKQFVYTQDHGLKKLIKKIEYPVDFELPENCLHDKSFTDKSLRTSRSYKLLAVVYHDGKEAIKGHYLTDVYHIGSSQWIRCDDSNLKVIPAPRIENPDSARTPYLLFYRRLNTLVRAPPGNHDNKKKSQIGRDF